MMIYCKTCGYLIPPDDLKSHFEITLGNISNGKFIGTKSLHYHRDCLSSLIKKHQAILRSEIIP